MRGDTPHLHFVRASERQEVYTEHNYLLGLVLILPQVVASVGDAVTRFCCTKRKIKISL